MKIVLPWKKAKVLLLSRSIAGKGVIREQATNIFLLFSVMIDDNKRGVKRNQPWFQAALCDKIGEEIDTPSYCDIYLKNLHDAIPGWLEKSK